MRPNHAKPLITPGPKAREYLKRDSQVISPSYPRASPFIMDRGVDCEVWDVDENRFIDMAAGIAVCNPEECWPNVENGNPAGGTNGPSGCRILYHPLWIE